MIKITQSQKNKLEEAGLLKHKTKYQDPNFYVANKEHLSRNKRYYVVEEPNILLFLGLGNNKSRNQNKQEQYY